MAEPWDPLQEGPNNSPVGSSQTLQTHVLTRACLNVAGVTAAHVCTWVLVCHGGSECMSVHTAMSGCVCTCVRVSMHTRVCRSACKERTGVLCMCVHACSQCAGSPE